MCSLPHPKITKNTKPSCRDCGPSPLTVLPLLQMDKQCFLSCALLLSEVMPGDRVTDWTTIKGWIETGEKQERKKNEGREKN